ncbi:MAG: hypothetical protein RDU76_06250 [Candidatus Edwardsbacteria bacterium]|nr:hypothetical protein [Candidatus Edwardsbacteria bacterium]
MQRHGNTLMDITPQKGFKGMREDKDPRAMDPGECLLMSGFRPRDGIMDGKYTGSGDPLNTVAFGFDIYDAVEFRSSQGVNYILALTSTGKIIYTANKWADWDNEAATKSFAETADGTDLELEGGSPHLHVAWIVRSNRDVVFSNGVDVYLIDGTTWPTSGALKVTSLTEFPPFIRGLYMGSRTVIDDGERYLLSSPNDPNRFKSTLQERLDKVYDDNQWVAAAAQGVSGYNTALCQMSETSAFAATQNGVFWIGLAPGENGIVSLNIICALQGAGCAIKDAAFVNEFGLFSFYSNYEGGSWLMLGRGSYSKLPGDPVNLTAEAGFYVRPLAPGIRNSLKAIYKGDGNLVGIGKDTKPEFEQVSARMRLGADTEADAGWMSLGVTNVIPYTVGRATTPWKNGGIGCLDASGNNVGGVYGAPLYDNHPAYPDITSPTYYRLVNQDYSFFLTKHTDPVLYADGKQISKIGPSTGWQEITVNKYCSSITLAWWYSNLTEDDDSDAKISRFSVTLYITGGPVYIAKMKIFGMTFTGTAGAVAGSNFINIGEIRLEGSDSTQVTYIDAIAKGTGLTASSQIDFGRFLAGFRKIDSEYYPKFKIRVGKSATLDTLGTTTLSGVHSAGGSSITVASASASGLEIGDQIKITDPTNGNETFYITAISGNVITPDSNLQYNHANGLTVTFLGSYSGLASANWSPWTELTLAQITAGYKFSALNYRTEGADTPAVTDASGNIWSHTKVTFDLKPSVGYSSAADYWRFQFLKGTLPLSNHMIRSSYDNSLIFATPLPGAAANNTVFGHKVDMNKAGSFKIPGQEIKAFVRSGSDYLAFMGRSWVLYWQGWKNFNGSGNSNVPLVREWQGQGIDEQRMRASSIKGLIRSYERDLSGYTVAATAAEKTMTPSGSLLPAELNGNSSMQWGNNNSSVVAGDGNEYFLVAWKDTTTTGKSDYDKNTSVDLIKLNRSTGAIERIAVDRSVNGNYDINGTNILLSADGNTLYLLWTGLTAAWNNRIVYNTFNVNSQKLGTEQNIIILPTPTQARWISSVIKDGIIYLVYVDYVGYTAYIYKSSKDHATWTLDKSVTAYRTDISPCYLYGPRLFINNAGNPVFTVVEQTNKISIWECVGGIWSSYPNVCTVAGSVYTNNSYAYLKHSGSEYLFVLFSATVYCYRNIYGTWTLDSTVSASAASSNNSIAAFSAYNTIIVVFSNGSGATVYFKRIDGATSWGSSTNIKTSYQSLYLCGNSYLTDNYLIIWAKKTTSDYWRVLRFTLTPTASNDESALVISLITASGTKNAYSGTESLEDEYRPKSGRPPRIGTVNTIRPKIRTTSPVEIAEMELTAEKNT